MHWWGAGRGGWTNKETGIDMITLRVAQIAIGHLLHSTESSSRCSVMTCRSGMGAVGERLTWEDICHIQLIHFVVQQKLTQHCKAIMLHKKRITENSMSRSIILFSLKFLKSKLNGIKKYRNVTAKLYSSSFPLKSQCIFDHF